MDEALKAELERLRDEDRRQNRRIEIVEGVTKEIQALALSIHGLAKDMEQMLQEQQEQGKRLDKQDERLGKIEERDGERWRKAVGYVGTTVLGILIGYIFKQIGII